MNMIGEAFFEALLDYAHKESLLMQYTERRAGRSALSRLDWDMINEAREENAEALQSSWQCANRSDSAH